MMVDTSLPFGQRIKQLRLSRGWMMQELADMVGITLSGQSYRESRDDVPNYETVLRYADVFGLKPHDIAPDIESDCYKTTAFGQMIYNLRINAGMSRSELCTRAGICRTTIQDIEADGHIPRFATMARIARVLGVSLDECVTTDMLEGMD